MGYLDDAIREHLELKRRNGASRGELDRAEQDAFGPVGASTEAVPAEGEDTVDDPYGDLGERFSREQDEPMRAGRQQPPVAEPEGETVPPPAGPDTPPIVDPAQDEPPPAPDDDPVPAPDDPGPPHGDPMHEQAGRGDEAAAEPPAVTAEPLRHDDPVDQPTQAYSLDELDAALAPEGAERHAEGFTRPARDDAPRADPDAIKRAWRGEGTPGPAAPAAGDSDDKVADGDDVLEETPEFLEETPEHERLWFEQKPPKDFDF